LDGISRSEEFDRAGIPAAKIGASIEGSSSHDRGSQE
jgi:hypothetical protein